MTLWSDESRKDIQYIYNHRGNIEKIIRLPGTELGRTTLFNYDDEDRLACLTWPNGASLYYRYDDKSHLHSLVSSGGSVDYRVECNEDGYVVSCVDANSGGCLTRKLTPQNQLLEEEFPSGDRVYYAYGDLGQLKEVTLSTYGGVRYGYEDSHLSKVTRVSPSGEPLYSHEYLWNPYSQAVAEETLIADLGKIQYLGDNQHLRATSPFGDYRLTIDPARGISEVRFDDIKQELLSRRYDCLGNPADAVVNEFNELLSYKDIVCQYDLNGNLISKKTPEGVVLFSYDALNRLSCVRSECTEVHFTYDIFGRRLSKETFSKKRGVKEYYLYQNSEEVAVVDDTRNLVALRILGLALHEYLTRAVSFEIPKGVYAPIYDHAHHVRKLINVATHEQQDYTDLSAFAENLSEMNPIIPWVYSTKHYDAETRLIYYGHRYYDPSIERWISIDPLWDKDSSNLYLFALNNPLNYYDPDGRFVLVIPLIGFSVKAMLTATAYASAAGAVAWGAYKVDKTIKEIKEETKRYEEWKESQKNEKPPYDGKVLGKDPSKCPGQGFEWRGKGKPGSSRGSWYNKETGESLHPDLDHPIPKKPHWDYQGPSGNKARLNTDGTWEWK